MHLVSLPGSGLDTAPGRVRRGRAARRRDSSFRRAGTRGPPARPGLRPGPRDEPGERRPEPRRALRKMLPISNTRFRGQPGPLRRRQIDVRLRAEQRGHPVGVSGLPGRIKFGENALFVRAEPAPGRRGPSPRRAPPPRAPPRGASLRGLLPRGERPRADRTGQPDATMPPLRQRDDQHGQYRDGDYSRNHSQPPCAGPVRIRPAKPCHARNLR